MHKTLSALVVSFSFGLVLLMGPSALESLTCPADKPKNNCVVNGAIVEQCGQCSQVKETVTPGSDSDAKTNTTATQTGSKTECDKVQLNSLTGGVITCWKEGVIGGKTNNADGTPVSCTAKQPTCASLRQQAVDAMKSGSAAGEQGAEGSQSGSAQTSEARDMVTAIDNAYQDAMGSAFDPKSLDSNVNNTTSDFTPEVQNDIVERAQQSLSRMADYFGTSQVPDDLANDSLFQRLNNSWGEFIKPLDLSFRPTDFAGPGTPDWMARGAANIANDSWGSINPNTPYYAPSGADTTFGAARASGELVSIDSPGPIQTFVNETVPAMWQSAKATVQDAWQNTVALLTSTPPADQFPENPFGEAEVVDVSNGITSSAVPTNDEILDSLGLLPSTEEIVGDGTRQLGTKSLVSFADDVVARSQSGESVSASEKLAAIAIAEEVQAEAQKNYDGRGIISRTADLVGLGSDEAGALAAANARLNALQKSPSQPIDFLAEAVQVGPNNSFEPVNLSQFGGRGGVPSVLQTNFGRESESLPDPLNTAANIDPRYADPNYTVPPVLNSIAQENSPIVANNQLAEAAQRIADAERGLYEKAGYEYSDYSCGGGGAICSGFRNQKLEDLRSESVRLATQQAQEERVGYQRLAEATRIEGQIESAAAREAKGHVVQKQYAADVQAGTAGLADLKGGGIVDGYRVYRPEEEAAKSEYEKALSDSVDRAIKAKSFTELPQEFAQSGAIRSGVIRDENGKLVPLGGIKLLPKDEGVVSALGQKYEAIAEANGKLYNPLLQSRAEALNSATQSFDTAARTNQQLFANEQLRTAAETQTMSAISAGQQAYDDAIAAYQARLADVTNRTTDPSRIRADQSYLVEKRSDELQRTIGGLEARQNEIRSNINDPNRGTDFGRIEEYATIERIQESIDAKTQTKTFLDATNDVLKSTDFNDEQARAIADLAFKTPATEEEAARQQLLQQALTNRYEAKQLASGEKDLGLLGNAWESTKQWVARSSSAYQQSVVAGLGVGQSGQFGREVAQPDILNASRIQVENDMLAGLVSDAPSPTVQQAIDAQIRNNNGEAASWMESFKNTLHTVGEPIAKFSGEMFLQAGSAPPIINAGLSVVGGAGWLVGETINGIGRAPAAFSYALNNPATNADIIYNATLAPELSAANRSVAFADAALNTLVVADVARIAASPITNRVSTILSANRYAADARAAQTYIENVVRPEIAELRARSLSEIDSIDTARTGQFFTRLDAEASAASKSYALAAERASELGVPGKVFTSSQETIVREATDVSRALNAGRSTERGVQAVVDDVTYALDNAGASRSAAEGFSGGIVRDVPPEANVVAPSPEPIRPSGGGGASVDVPAATVVPDALPRAASDVSGRSEISPIIGDAGVGRLVPQTVSPVRFQNTREALRSAGSGGLSSGGALALGRIAEAVVADVRNLRAPTRTVAPVLDSTVIASRTLTEQARAVVGADITVIPGISRALPGALNYLGLDVVPTTPGQVPVRDSVDFAAEAALEWLARPIITETKAGTTDSLTNAERLQLRTNLENTSPGAYALYEGNKLRGNSITALQTAMDTMNRSIRGNNVSSAVADDLARLYDPTLFPSGRAYDSLPLDQKLQVVQNIDTLAQKYLDIVAPSTPSPDGVPTVPANAPRQVGNRTGLIRGGIASLALFNPITDIKFPLLGALEMPSIIRSAPATAASPGTKYTLTVLGKKQTYTVQSLEDVARQVDEPLRTTGASIFKHCSEDRYNTCGLNASGQAMKKQDYYSGPKSMTVAHKTLPFGTVVELTYKGKTVLAQVNTRGPYAPGRDFDLTPAVAGAIGLKGVGNVQYRIVKAPTAQEARYIRNRNDLGTFDVSSPTRVADGGVSPANGTLAPSEANQVQQPRVVQVNTEPVAGAGEQLLKPVNLSTGVAGNANNLADRSLVRAAGLVDDTAPKASQTNIDPRTPPTKEQTNIIARTVIDEMGGPEALRRIYTYDADGTVRDLATGKELPGFKMQPTDSAAKLGRLSKGYNKVDGNLVALNEMMRRMLGETIPFNSGARPTTIGSNRHHSWVKGPDGKRVLVSYALDYAVRNADMKAAVVAASNRARFVLNEELVKYGKDAKVIPYSVGARYPGSGLMVHIDTAPASVAQGRGGESRTWGSAWVDRNLGGVLDTIFPSRKKGRTAIVAELPHSNFEKIAQKAGLGVSVTINTPSGAHIVDVALNKPTTPLSVTFSANPDVLAWSASNPHIPFPGTLSPLEFSFSFKTPVTQTLVERIATTPVEDIRPIAPPATVIQSPSAPALAAKTQGEWVIRIGAKVPLSKADIDGWNAGGIHVVHIDPEQMTVGKLQDIKNGVPGRQVIGYYNGGALQPGESLGRTGSGVKTYTLDGYPDEKVIAINNAGREFQKGRLGAYLEKMKTEGKLDSIDVVAYDNPFACMVQSACLRGSGFKNARDAAETMTKHFEEIAAIAHQYGKGIELKNPHMVQDVFSSAQFARMFDATDIVIAERSLEFKLAGGAPEAQLYASLPPDKSLYIVEFKGDPDVYARQLQDLGVKRASVTVTPDGYLEATQKTAAFDTTPPSSAPTLVEIASVDMLVPLNSVTAAPVTAANRSPFSLIVARDEVPETIVARTVADAPEAPAPIARNGEAGILPVSNDSALLPGLSNVAENARNVEQGNVAPLNTANRELIARARNELSASKKAIDAPLNSLRGVRDNLKKAEAEGGLSGLNLAKQTAPTIESPARRLAGMARTIAENPLVSATDRARLLQDAVRVQSGATNLRRAIEDFSVFSIAASKKRVATQAVNFKKAVESIVTTSEKAGQPIPISSTYTASLNEVLASIDELERIATNIPDSAIIVARGPFDTIMARDVAQLDVDVVVRLPVPRPVEIEVSVNTPAATAPQDVPQAPTVPQRNPSTDVAIETPSSDRPAIVDPNAKSSVSSPGEFPVGIKPEDPEFIQPPSAGQVVDSAPPPPPSPLPGGARVAVRPNEPRLELAGEGGVTPSARSPFSIQDLLRRSDEAVPNLVPEDVGGVPGDASARALAGIDDIGDDAVVALADNAFPLPSFLRPPGEQVSFSLNGPFSFRPLARDLSGPTEGLGAVRPSSESSLRAVADEVSPNTTPRESFAQTIADARVLVAPVTNRLASGWSSVKEAARSAFQRNASVSETTPVALSGGGVDDVVRVGGENITSPPSSQKPPPLPNVEAPASLPDAPSPSAPVLRSPEQIVPPPLPEAVTPGVRTVDDVSAPDSVVAIPPPLPHTGAFAVPPPLPPSATGVAAPPARTQPDLIAGFNTWSAQQGTQTNSRWARAKNAWGYCVRNGNACLVGIVGTGGVVAYIFSGSGEPAETPNTNTSEGVSSSAPANTTNSEGGVVTSVSPTSPKADATGEQDNTDSGSAGEDASKNDSGDSGVGGDGSGGNKGGTGVPGTDGNNKGDGAGSGIGSAGADSGAGGGISSGGDAGAGGGAGSGSSGANQPRGFSRGGMSLLQGLMQGLFAFFGQGGEDEEPKNQPQPAPQPTPRPEVFVGTIVANPSLIDSGATTTISWSSVGTDVSSSTCAVISADFAVIHRGGQNGSIGSGRLTESTRFGLVCNTNNAKDKLLHETLVRVRGDESDPERIFTPQEIAASQSTLANTGGSGGAAGGGSGGQGSSGQSGNPAPQDVRTCDPEQSINSFILCLCEAEPNPAGCTVPAGGLR